MLQVLQPLVLSQVVLLEQQSWPLRQVAPWAPEPPSPRLARVRGQQVLELQTPPELGLRGQPEQRVEQVQQPRQVAEQLIARLEQPLLMQLERGLQAAPQLEPWRLAQQQPELQQAPLQRVGLQQARQPQPAGAHR